jgi:FMN-dependent NADH-azoreductase
MTNILFVTSSPRGAASHSSRVAEQVVERLQAAAPGSVVVRRDLNREPLPHLGETLLGAFFSSPDAHSEEQRDLVALSDKLVDEVFAADVIVIAAAMINFSIPSTLKTWLDYIARSGKTFRYGEKGPEGLVTGKHVILVEAKGGIYSEGPMKIHDYQQPYLRFILGFMGMTDVEVVGVEGVAFGPEAAEKALAAAGIRADEAARTVHEARAAA